MIRNFLFVFALGAAFALPAFSQTVSPSRIAVINSYQFTDEKVGIIRFVNAFKSVDSEFAKPKAELDAMNTKLNALSGEIERLRSSSAPVQPNSLNAKLLEADQLQRDLKFKAESLKADYERRQQQVVGPVLREIGTALVDFAKQKGFALLFDVAKDEVGLLVAIGDEKVDVTNDFIAFFNAKPAPAPANAQ